MMVCFSTTHKKNAADKSQKLLTNNHVFNNIFFFLIALNQNITTGLINLKEKDIYNISLIDQLEQSILEDKWKQQEKTNVKQKTTMGLKRVENSSNLYKNKPKITKTITILFLNELKIQLI